MPSKSSVDLFKDTLMRSGAGTGKTTALIDEFFKLSQDYFKKEKSYPFFVVTTFTKKATEELKQRLITKSIEGGKDDFLQHLYSDMHISTIDGLLNQFLKRYSSLIGMNHSFDLVSEKFSKNKIKEKIIQSKNHPLTESIYDIFSLKQWVDSLYEYQVHKRSYKNLSIFKGEGYEGEINLEEVNLGKKFIDHANDLIPELIRDKKQSGEIDIKDLELFSLELIEKHPQVLKDFSQLWDYWFIDEYQDISENQDYIIERLKGDKKAFMVGDPKQSIYLFRGAKASVFENKEKKIKAIKSKSNYRSDSPLVHFFNDLFHYDASFIKLESKKEKVNSDPCFIKLSIQEEQKKAMLYQMIDLRNKNVPFKDMFVLTQTNDQAREVHRFLMDNKIPCSYQSDDFINKDLIKDAFFLLKFLIQPHNDLNLLSFLRSPFYYQTDELLKDLIKDKNETSLYSYLKKINHPIYQKLNEKIKLKQKLSLSETFISCLKDFSFFEAFQNYHDHESYEIQLWKIIDWLGGEEKKQSFDPSNKLIYDIENEYTEWSESSQTQSSSVSIMTIHKSKGLSLPYVFIPFLENEMKQQGNKTCVCFEQKQKKVYFCIPKDHHLIKNEKNSPLQRVNKIFKEKNEHFEIELRKEKIRLFYVAVTRAKKAIFMSASKMPEEQKKAFSYLSWISENYLKKDIHREGKIQKNNYCIEIEKSLKKQNLKGQDSVSLKKEEKMEIKNFIKEKPFRTVTDLIDQKESKKLSKSNLKETVLKIVKGNRLHQSLEKIKYSKNKIEEKSILEALNSEKIPLKKMIDEGYVEWSFKIQKKNFILKGQIDLWGEVDGTLWICDYKTGSDLFIEKAFNQLDLYAWAIHHIFGKKADKLAVIYLDPFKLHIRNISDLKKIENKYNL